MNSTIAQGILLRLLPAVVVLVLAFVAAADTKTRDRWSDLLYQLGMLQPEKKSDPQIQKGVRIPFFVVAVCLLFWPISYFFHADRTLQISEGSDLFTGGLKNSHKAAPAPVVSNPGVNSAGGNAAPAAPVIPTATPVQVINGGLPH